MNLQMVFGSMLVVSDLEQKQSFIEELWIANVIFRGFVISSSRFPRILWYIYLVQVNNAGASGVVVDEERLKALNIDPETWVS